VRNLSIFLSAEYGIESGSDTRIADLLKHLQLKENTREIFCFATTLPQANSYGKMNLTTWEKTKWQIGLSGEESTLAPG
jgi:hypothetical protein